MSTLLIWLEGPLQSWGHDSWFDRRETLPFPTLSGVCGILCAALGAGGSQEELLSKLVHAKWETLSYSNANQQIPQLCDFQVIGNGYDPDDPWLTLFIPKTSNGTRPNGIGSKRTYRYFLQSAAFAVLLTYGENSFAEKIAAALKNPVWPLSLGRRCCAPSEMIFQGIFEFEETARSKANDIARAKGREIIFQVMEGAYPESGEVFLVNDVPVSFGIKKIYRNRYVTLCNALKQP